VGTSSLLRAEQNTLNLSSLARIIDTVKTLHTQGEATERPGARRGTHPQLRALAMDRQGAAAAAGRSRSRAPTASG
jgi:hypothetical protein